MTMSLRLLVVAMAVGLSVAEVPPYKEYVQALKEAAKTLETNVLSMEGRIPLLDETKRHYVVIIHVVIDYAAKAYHLSFRPFYDEYYRLLNTSAPEAINYPEKVIVEVKQLLKEIHIIVKEVIYLINACHDTPAVCNQLIEDTINENISQYGVGALVLRRAGEAAREFNKINERFEVVSNALTAHQYVWSSPGELKNLVARLIFLYQTLRM